MMIDTFNMQQQLHGTMAKNSQRNVKNQLFYKKI